MSANVALRSTAESLFKLITLTLTSFRYEFKSWVFTTRRQCLIQ